MDIGYKLIGARLVTMPQSTEPRFRQRVISYPRAACKKRLRAVLSRNPLEYQPVYNNDHEDQNYGVSESFQEKRAEARLSRPKEDRRSSFIWRLPPRPENSLKIRTGDHSNFRDMRKDMKRFQPVRCPISDHDLWNCDKPFRDGRNG
jgi:hypothetical protein